MIVAKFGGTSVSTAARIRTLCEIVSKLAKNDPLVVVSALAGVTNLLLSLPNAPSQQQKRGIHEIYKIHKLLIEDFFADKRLREDLILFINKQIDALETLVKRGNSDTEALDRIAAFGEIISSRIVADALQVSGIPAKQIIATEIIVTNNNFGSAEFLPKPSQSRIRKCLLPLVNSHIVPVITGFIGVTRDGKITTLGRGGSDYTASIVGYCLRAKEIQIWTDVDGVYSADPRIVKTAKNLPEISFKEASELATFGARVLHPRSIKPAIKAGIPVRVLNTFNHKSTGTLIVVKPKLTHPIRSICSKRNITLVNVYSTEMLLAKGFLARIFQIFARHNISIDLVSVSEVSVSVTLDNDDRLEQAVLDLERFAQVSSTKNLAIISIIGEGITTSSRTIRDIFAVLNDHNILVKMVSLGATDINISLVIDNSKVEETVPILHDAVVR